MRQDLFFFIKCIDCGIGGMETHQRAFMEFFSTITSNINLYIVEKYNCGFRIYNRLASKLILICESTTTSVLCRIISNLSSNLPIFFLNDFWWIEEIPVLRGCFSSSKIFIRSGGNDIEKAPWNKEQLTYEKRLEKCVESLMTTSYVIVNSTFSSHRFTAKGIPESKLLKIRGGVDLTECLKIIQDKPSLKYWFRNKYEIHEKYIFVFACRMVEFKGIDIALTAFAKSTIFGQGHFVFVGEGDKSKEIKDACVLSGIPFTFLGAIPNSETLRVIGAADCLVNTSILQMKRHKDHTYIHTETMGRSMMEAISVHTPILATNVGGTSELFSECGNIGILTDCDIKSISNAFSRFTMYNYSFAKCMDYSWEYIFGEYIKHF